MAEASERRRLSTLNSSLSEALKTISDCDAIMERLHRARAGRTRTVSPPCSPIAARRIPVVKEDLVSSRTSDSNREIIRKLDEMTISCTEAKAEVQRQRRQLAELRSEVETEKEHSNHLETECRTLRQQLEEAGQRAQHHREEVEEVNDLWQQRAATIESELERMRSEVTQLRTENQRIRGPLPSQTQQSTKARPVSNRPLKQPTRMPLPQQDVTGLSGLLSDIASLRGVTQENELLLDEAEGRLTQNAKVLRGASSHTSSKASSSTMASKRTVARTGRH